MILLAVVAVGAFSGEIGRTFSDVTVSLFALIVSSGAVASIWKEKRNERAV
jgi:hypothetical protein